jgi:hypothetical protein
MTQATWNGFTRSFDSATEAQAWIDTLERLAENDYDAAERYAYGDENEGQDIIVVSDHVEIHPAAGGHAVVRDGAVHGTYESLDYAREVAQEIAGEEQ